MRGLGESLPPCSSVVTAPGFVGPVDCDPTDGGVSYPASQSQVASIWDAINAGAAPYFPVAAPTASFAGWLNANSSTVLIGSGVFVGLLFALKAMR